MNKVLISLIGLIALVGIATGAIFFVSKPKVDFGANIQATNVLVGSSTSVVSTTLSMISSSTVFADTNPAVGVSGTATTSAITQLVATEGYDKVRLDIVARGGTGTSTLFIRQMGSDNGYHYFDIPNSTSTLPDKRTIVGTSTLSNAETIAVQWDAGTATTTKSVLFDTYGYAYTRFLIWGEDVTADPNDGTYAYIQAVSIK